MTGVRCFSITLTLTMTNIGYKYYEHPTVVFEAFSISILLPYKKMLSSSVKRSRGGTLDELSSLLRIGV